MAWIIIAVLSSAIVIGGTMLFRRAIERSDQDPETFDDCPWPLSPRGNSVHQIQPDEDF